MPADVSYRPGRVVRIDGVVFQCDADDMVSTLLIRPMQRLSQRLRGRERGFSSSGVPLANHAGIRICIACPHGSTQTYVVEQLSGTLWQNVANGLSWTTWRKFKAREGGGWDVTVPCLAFEGVTPADVAAAIDVLNEETGQAFYSEICTAFIERVFGGHRLFNEVEALHWLVRGAGLRIPEPAAPRFRRNAYLSRRARHLLRTKELMAVRAQIDQIAGANACQVSGAEVLDVDALPRFVDRGITPASAWYWALAQISRLW